jgi:hypothetical protein
MSGGWQSRPKNVGWCGPERSDYPARVFCPQGLALTAWGPQAPTSKTKVSRRVSLKQAIGACAAQSEYEEDPWGV